MQGVAQFGLYGGRVYRTTPSEPWLCSGLRETVKRHRRKSRAGHDIFWGGNFLLSAVISKGEFWSPSRNSVVMGIIRYHKWWYYIYAGTYGIYDVIDASIPRKVSHCLTKWQRDEHHTVTCFGFAPFSEPYAMSILQVASSRRLLLTILACLLLILALEVSDCSALPGQKANIERQRIPILQYHDEWVCVNKPPGLSVHRSANTPRTKPVLTSTLKRQLAR